ncbi:cation transport protein-domain-containing protein [Microdochium trichocladiopsis]|uniref:Potassium transport protein n=1 Tax=Microdochium trichocladiopsis TaxID=1682393 RepID=A0A9P9BP42_9PEZI|nr:cation transport protein-domain-containing protein [Microdochium trichocladiopsis]KAH7021508.1 cation transport protein-domain-containing protein [Microdochium trichocladiopsis]
MRGFPDGRLRSGLSSALSGLAAVCPPLNFITIHYAYFIVVPLVTSLIFWGSSKPSYTISYVDSLFLVTSAMTEAGLNTINLSQMTTFQQMLLAFLIVIGGQIWVSIWTVQVRKHAFEQRFKEVVRRERQRQLDRRGTGQSFMSRLSTLRTSRSHTQIPIHDPGSEPAATQQAHTPGTSDQPATLAMRETLPEPSSPRSPGDHITFADRSSHSHDVGVTRRHGQHRAGTDTVASEKDARDIGKLSKERRDELGGTEYRALKLLSFIVPAYFFCWQILGCIALGAWIAVNLPQPALDNAINPWWNGVFNGLSAFNNSGMSVLDLNMIPYQDAYFVQIVMGCMILAGNTAYPILLRLGIWAGLKVLNWATPGGSFTEWKDTLAYILKYPRRVYTNMFGSRQTWWLLFMLILLNGTDWVAYEILNLGNTELEKIPVGSRIMNGLFQALAVRAGGFYIVPIPILYIGLQVLYVVMMYISAYPVVITMRHSNIYEERSLGIYPDSDAISHPLQRSPSVGSRQSRVERRRNSVSRAIRGTLFDWSGVGAVVPPTSHGQVQSSDRRSAPFRDAGPSSANNDTSGSFVRHQIRSQLSHDLWLIVLAVLLIAIIETKHFLEDPVTYSVFNILFEVVSAYGCVGISLGVPWNNFSFAGGWYSGSKLVLVLVMLRGRHRGLPVALDRAVQLPSDDMDDVEDQEDLRARRSMSARGQRQEVAI